MTTAPKIAKEIQLLAVNPIVELFEIDTTALTGTILRFTPAPLVPDPTLPVPVTVTWRGFTYPPRACQTSGWSWDGTGPLPTPKMVLGNTDLSISALTIGYGDLLGSTVTRHRTFQKYLDGQPLADSTVEFDPDVFRIERKSSQNKNVVEFELGTAIDVQGRQLPGRQVVQGFCSLRYRVWNGTAFDYSNATCPYTGSNYFRLDGTATPNASEDRAAKRLALCCTKRFPNQALPFGGFPGAGRF